jgi:hypothetical protein
MKSKNNIGTILFSLTLIHCGSSLKNPSSSHRQATPPATENTLCPGARSENTDGYGGGDGTIGNPYLICTNNQFKNIHGDMNLKRFFRLTADLDFSGEGNIRIIAIAPFATIDGDNHKLKNVTIEHGHGYKDNGLFGQLTKDPNGNRDEIKNLIIENVKITGDGTADGAGVIASANWEGIISNVHITGVVSINYPDASPNSWAVGGIVGRNSSLIENSSFDGQVTGVYNVGGIAGINDGIIRNSTVSGTVQGHQGVGGLIGVQLIPGISTNNTTAAKVFGLKNFGDQIGVLCDGTSYTACHL